VARRARVLHDVVGEAHRPIALTLQPDDARIERLRDDPLVPLIADDVLPAGASEVRGKQRLELSTRRRLITEEVQDRAHEPGANERFIGSVRVADTARRRAAKPSASR
jgi:hypothetical protein